MIQESKNEYEPSGLGLIAAEIIITLNSRFVLSILNKIGKNNSYAWFFVTGPTIIFLIFIEFYLLTSLFFDYKRAFQGLEQIFYFTLIYCFIGRKFFLKWVDEEDHPSE